MTVPMKQPPQGDIMESVLIKGDLAKLTPDERVRYYGEVCRSVGLNPLTKPFEFIMLNGKLQLYALRTCADQLRKINGVSLEIVSREVAHDILTVHVRAKLPDGRADEDLGAVAFPETLKGEARANAELKAVTKAKRRATLSICGLGWLDETEVEDIPGAKRPSRPAPNVMLPNPEVALPSTAASQPVTSEGNNEPDVTGAVYPPYQPTEYIEEWDEKLTNATDPKMLIKEWNSELQKQIRRATFDDEDEQLKALIKRVAARASDLKKVAA